MQFDGFDQVPRQERMLPIRSVSGRQIETGNRNSPCSGDPSHENRRVQSGKSNRQIGGVRSDTRIAGPEDGMVAVVAADRRTARAGDPLVARCIGIAEIGAPRALKQVAANGGDIANLGRRRRQQRLRESGPAGTDRLVVGHISHAGESADSSPAVAQNFHAVQPG